MPQRYSEPIRTDGAGVSAHGGDVKLHPILQLVIACGVHLVCVGAVAGTFHAGNLSGLVLSLAASMVVPAVLVLMGACWRLAYDAEAAALARGLQRWSDANASSRDRLTRAKA